MLALAFLCSLCTSYVLGVQKDVPEIGDRTHSNPETAAGYFEGDIELNGYNPLDKNAVRPQRWIWPNGVIPYKISSSYDDGTRATILNAMQEIMNDTKVHGNTCVAFVPHTYQHDYVEVVSGSGCHAHIGHAGGHQTCTISEGCHRKGTIMHELLHTLGFYHEQVEPNRDQYVTIVWENIRKGEEHNFEKHSSSELQTFGLPYDYNSIMHYNAYEFSKDDNKPTIIPKQKGVDIGQRIRLSALDIKKIQLLYGCIPKGSTYMPSTVAPPKVYNDACTFSHDMCDWHNLGNDDTNWGRRWGDTPSHNTGPSYDNSLNHNDKAFYLYVEASSHDLDSAVIASKQYKAGSYCVTFYYHMYGKDMGSLSLRAAQGSHHNTIKTISGNQGDIWKKMEVPYTSSHEFEFVGTIGRHHYSDIAIDDISVHSGSCPGAGGLIG